MKKLSKLKLSNLSAMTEDEMKLIIGGYDWGKDCRGQVGYHYYCSLTHAGGTISGSLCTTSKDPAIIYAQLLCSRANLCGSMPKCW